MPALNSQTIYDAIKELGVIEEKDLDAAFKLAESRDVLLSEIILEKDLVDEVNLYKLMADVIGIDFVDLDNVMISDEVLDRIPQVIAEKHMIFPFMEDEFGLHLAMKDPTDLQILSFLEKKLGVSIVPYLASDRSITQAFTHYAKDVGETFGKLIESNVEKLKKSEEISAPIIEIVDEIMRYAIKNKTSDVHIEVSDQVSLVRFRIDGILHDIVRLPLKLHRSIISRIKIIARLRTDEHQAAQDGKFTYKLDQSKVNVRVSIIPTTREEKVVMRLLSETTRQFSLSTVGLSETNHELVRQATKKTTGMILVVGPTGSGKTTTLYSILKTLNRREVNIATIEDPVEYDIENISQIQVNPQTNLTFADGLKSLVRQDPDILLVGEIRDSETAQIAVNAAMTGHLVLSSLHTNDAATTIPRLIDMGIEPYLIASTLNIVIAQRLVRQVHSSCRVSQEIFPQSLSGQLPDDLIEEMFGGKKKVRVYLGKGCEVCHDSGYSGRLGLFEVLVADDEIRKAITEKKDAQFIEDLAVKKGMKTLIYDGLQKAMQGLTTIDEVLRVMNSG